MSRFWLQQPCRYLIYQVGPKCVAPLTGASVTSHIGRSKIFSLYTTAPSFYATCQLCGRRRDDSKCGSGRLERSLLATGAMKDRNDYTTMHTGNTLFARGSLLDKKKMIDNFLAVKMINLKEVPTTVFWFGVLGLAPYVVPPLLYVIVGYMPLVGKAQLIYSAVILSYIGGIKFGSMVQCEKKECSWENVFLTSIPSLWGWFGLLLPDLFGFLALAAGISASLAIDLASTKYPPWFHSLRCMLSTTAVIFLLITMFQCLLHKEK